ncbi:MFS general substrate transporter [Xylariaceae sp. FL0594]|nr:MFS general substrate transporter [Xylariaceae sp. FL0594]
MNVETRVSTMNYAGWHGSVDLDRHRVFGLPAPSSHASDGYYRNEQGHHGMLTVPQAVRYGPEDWAQHENVARRYENFITDQITPAVHTSQHLGQGHFHIEQVNDGSNVPPAGIYPAAITHLHPDGWQHRTALVDPVIPKYHPRQDLAPWKWKLVLVAINILWLVTGYDISNIANIQAPIYTAFHDLEILPWVVLSYSICSVTVTPLARKLFKFYDIKLLTTGGLVLAIIGTSIAASAPNLVQLITGRAVMAFGAAVVYQGILTVSVIYLYPSEISLVYATYGASFAFGVLTGPVIGAALAQDEKATWRWSFYLCLPTLTAALLLCVLVLPRYSAPAGKTVSRHLREIDWLGHSLHVSTCISFGLATVFSGPAWPWGSVRQQVIWAIFGASAFAYVVQQALSIATKPKRRIIPIYLLKKRVVLLTCLCTAGAAVTYGVALYYTPLLFAFAREIGPLEAALRLLSLTASFIIAIFVTHAVLPWARFYMPFYLGGNVLLLTATILLRTSAPYTSLPALMGFNALIGAGVGVQWNLSVPVSSAVLADTEEQLDQTTLHSLAQLGGTAIALSISAAVYGNVGLGLVKKAVRFRGYTDMEILALLSGAESAMLDAFSPEARTLVIGAVAETIGRIYYVAIGGAALALLASVFLRFEPLHLPRLIWASAADDRRKDGPGIELSEGVNYDSRRRHVG